MKFKRMPITKARNDFFRIVKRSYLKKEIVLVEKGDIPMSYIIPASTDGVEKLISKSKTE